MTYAQIERATLSRLTKRDVTVASLESLLAARREESQTQTAPEAWENAATNSTQLPPQDQDERMQTVNDAIRLLRRQAELETAMRMAEGIRITEVSARDAESWAIRAHGAAR